MNLPLSDPTAAMDLVVATPVFLDLTFVGLDGLPVLGEELFAADLMQTPGGGAITAIAAARLGLSTAIAAPLGRDEAGDVVRAALAAEGVELVERSAARTPTTVVFPLSGDRAMVTVDPGVRASAADVAGLQPRAVALSLDQLYAVPEGANAYVTVGDDDARAYAGRPPALLGRARALFVNQREALGLTNELTVDAAAARLAEMVDTVIVTLGPGGAIAVSGSKRSATSAEANTEPTDTTGAGDVLAAAFIWADLHGASTQSALDWAVLYASTAVGAPTGIGGAMTLGDMLAAGGARGLEMPPAISASAD
jgi:sugar/nucleoside kinase (ribokinase family)